MKYILLTAFLLISLSMSAQGPTLELPKGCKENYFITSDNIGIRYVTAGKGRALILVPGWTMPAEIWEKQIEYFSKTNLVIAVDPRCQGKSAKTSEGLYFEREAKDISELAQHLKLSAYFIVGWSWAGPVICSYLKNFKTPALKGAVIVDGPVRFTKEFVGFVTNMTISLLQDRKNFTPVFVKSLFVQPWSDAYLEKVGKASLKTPTSAAITLLANFLVYSDKEYMEILKTNSVPLLFYLDEKKVPVYEDLRKEGKLNVVVIPGGGHTPFVDKPAEFNKIVQDFIGKH
jgi:non-heme chloroperoxidase